MCRIRILAAAAETQALGKARTMTPSKWQPRLYALILAAISLPLLSGGGKLVVLGGSPYYVLAGAALAART